MLKANVKKKILDNRTRDLVHECQINGTTHLLPKWIKPPEDDNVEAYPSENLDTVGHHVPEFEPEETSAHEFGVVLINACKFL